MAVREIYDDKRETRPCGVRYGDKRKDDTAKPPAREEAGGSFTGAALIDGVFDKDFDKEFLASLVPIDPPSRADWSS